HRFGVVGFDVDSGGAARLDLRGGGHAAFAEARRVHRQLHDGGVETLARFRPGDSATDEVDRRIDHQRNDASRVAGLFAGPADRERLVAGLDVPDDRRALQRHGEGRGAAFLERLLHEVDVFGSGVPVDANGDVGVATPFLRADAQARTERLGCRLLPGLALRGRMPDGHTPHHDHGGHAARDPPLNTGCMYVPAPYSTERGA